MSAGGEFNYEFVCWKPERVVAFVVNKGNIYYTALAPKAARSVPGILFTGGKDLEFRTSTITGLFAMNRRGGRAVGAGRGAERRRTSSDARATWRWCCSRTRSRFASATARR